MLSGQTAIVTGASRGIGRAVALELAQHGAKVAVNYATSTEKAQEVVDMIKSNGGQAIKVQADVAQESEVKQLVQAAFEEWGRIDILVNNAGITCDNLLLRMRPSEWEKVISTNLNSVYYCTRAVLKPMLKQKGGRIVNMTSVIGQRGNAGQANYAAAKAGIIAFTKSVAQEVSSRGILVNAVAPGYIITDMTEGLDAKVKEELEKNIPQGRLGKPEDVARVIAFLASPAADYVTGQTINVDGGMVMV